MTLSILDTVISLDERCFLAINGWHTLTMDFAMKLISSVSFWIPLYVLLIFLYYRRYNWKKTLIWLIFIALCVFLCDRVSAGLLRPFFGRLRPSNLNNPISDMVYVLNGKRGGAYSFPSSHATNMAGITMFWFLTYGRGTITWCLIPWTLVVCYSRMYLGLHYPCDLLCGIVLGIFFAFSVSLVYNFIIGKYDNRRCDSVGGRK